MSTGDVSDEGNLTAEETARDNHFLDVFGEIEAELQRRLGLAEHRPLVQMTQQYERRNPFWRDDAELLRRFAKVRNILAHHRNTVTRFPFAVSRNSLAALRGICDRLHHPRLVREWYGYPDCSPVVTVPPAHPLDDVLQLAYRNGFSQFPVVDGGRFHGVVTETEVTRWLGRQLLDGRNQFGFAGVTVEQVMREREPDREAVFEFRRFDDAVEEVMALFHQRPGLEVVLLTESGNRDTPIGGIITQWDAARYPDATPE